MTKLNLYRIKVQSDICSFRQAKVIRTRIEISSPNFSLQKITTDKIKADKKHN